MNGVAPSPIESPAAGRLMSLDVFRGATIAAMMLVNNPGSWNALYKPLDHAEWHGWTFTDLIFPFFLWIVGVAMPLSMSCRLEQGQSRTELFLHALRRSAIIFGLGLFLNCFSYFINGSLFRDGFSAWLHEFATNVRIPGVLQRIGICYLVASIILLRTGIRGQLIALVSLLAGYWVLMMCVPVSGHTGSLEMEGNLAQYIDNLVLNGPVIGTHVWKGGKTWDPEGIFSTIPAIATCLFGVMTGHLLRGGLSGDTLKGGHQTGNLKGGHLTPEAKTAWLFVGGNLLLLAGVVMDVWLPINKKLWTSSYAVFMAGMAMNCFGVCYWLVDVQGWRKWAKPFAIYGMNAIVMFMLAGISGRILLEVKVHNAVGETVALKTFLFDKLCAPWASSDTAPFFGFLASPKNASLMWAIMYVVALYLVAYGMYRKKWFVKF